MKYKRCHGRLDDPDGIPVHTGPLPAEIVRVIQAHQTEHLRHERTHGEVRPIISTEFQGHRLVATGKKLLWGKEWKVFPDFLNQYLHNLLGKEWGARQVKLPFAQQHPLVQWRTIFTTAQQSQTPDERGLYDARNGAAMCWFRIAYDLYLIEHNAELQKRLVKRLRDRVGFQGARFEAAVAAMILAAGYELHFADERGPGKHPEFVATHRRTGHRLAVEAKSRHRAGVLGFPGDKAAESPTSFDVDGLLNAALEKDTAEPLLVFVELNSPQIAKDMTGTEFHAELSKAWKGAQARNWPNGFPAIGVVFYNDAMPWFLESLPRAGAAPVFVLTMWAENSRHNFDPRALLMRVTEGCGQRLTIPHEFPAK